MKVYGIRLPPEQVAQLRRIARERGLRDDADVRWAQLAREAIGRLIQAERPPTPQPKGE